MCSCCRAQSPEPRGGAYVRYFRYSTVLYVLYVRDGWSGRQQHQQQTTTAVSRMQPRVHPVFWPSTPGYGPLPARLERLSPRARAELDVGREGNHEPSSRTAKMYGTKVLRFGLPWTSPAVIGRLKTSPQDLPSDAQRKSTSSTCPRPDAPQRATQREERGEISRASLARIVCVADTCIDPISGSMGAVEVYNTHHTAWRTSTWLSSQYLREGPTASHKPTQPRRYNLIPSYPHPDRTPTYHNSARKPAALPLCYFTYHRIQRVH
jgi:hypothetical protein